MGGWVMDAAAALKGARKTHGTIHYSHNSRFLVDAGEATGADVVILVRVPIEENVLGEPTRNKKAPPSSQKKNITG